MSVFDPRSLLLSEIISLESKLKYLKLKNLIGLADKNEITKIEERLVELRKRLLNMPLYL